MSENNTDGRRIWFIVLPIIFILSLGGVVLASVVIPGLSKEQRIDYGIKALTTTGTIFAGIAVFINAFYAGKNAEVAEDKQITERFAKAIEQLGSEKIEVRLGAIYTLERIAKDSAKDHWTIMEVLTAFVRENAPRKTEEENTQQAPEIRTDIQAALTVIGRRNSENEQENQMLDLNKIDIRKAILSRANLQKAILGGTNLQGASFYNAHLQNSTLIEANLQGAILDGANLDRANLQGADLTGAKNIEQCQIERAKGDRTTKLPDHLKYPEHWQ